MTIAELLVIARTVIATHDIATTAEEDRKYAAEVVADVYGEPCAAFANVSSADGYNFDSTCQRHECIRPTCGWPQRAHRRLL